MDELGGYRDLTPDEIVGSLAAIGQAVARLTGPERTMRASLGPEGILIESRRGTAPPVTRLIALRVLTRKPGYLLAQEVEALARRS